MLTSNFHAYDRAIVLPGERHDILRQLESTLLHRLRLPQIERHGISNHSTSHLLVS